MKVTLNRYPLGHHPLTGTLTKIAPVKLVKGGRMGKVQSNIGNSLMALLCRVPRTDDDISEDLSSDSCGSDVYDLMEAMSLARVAIASRGDELSESHHLIPFS